MRKKSKKIILAVVMLITVISVFSLNVFAGTLSTSPAELYNYSGIKTDIEIEAKQFGDTESGKVLRARARIDDTFFTDQPTKNSQVYKGSLRFYPLRNVTESSIMMNYRSIIENVKYTNGAEFMFLKMEDIKDEFRYNLNTYYVHSITIDMKDWIYSGYGPYIQLENLFGDYVVKNEVTYKQTTGLYREDGKYQVLITDKTETSKYEIKAGATGSNEYVFFPVTLLERDQVSIQKPNSNIENISKNINDYYITEWKVTIYSKDESMNYENMNIRLPIGHTKNISPNKPDPDSYNYYMNTINARLAEYTTYNYEIVDIKANDFWDFIKTSVGGFFEFELIPNISIGNIVGTILIVVFMIVILKVFAGG